MKPWCGYIRVSVVGGREGDSFRSPSDQEKSIRGKAAERGEPVEVLVPDLDAKGDDPERDTLMQGIEGVESGRYRGLIVPYLSRLSRRTRDTLDMWDRVKAAGGTILVVEGDLDSDKETPELRFQLTVLSAMDEMEHRRATERFARQRRSAVERGIWMSRVVPRGYVKNPDTRRLELGPDWEEVRAKGFRAHAGRRSITDIAVDLGMTYTGAKRLLRNRVYLGELKDGEYVNTEAHPPLVTEEEWIAAQVWAPRKRRGGPPQHSLLQGLVRCASCGFSMTAGGQAAKRTYQCQGVSAAGRCPAPAGIQQRRLDEYVEPIALAEFAKLQTRAAEDPGHLDELRAAARRAREELSGYLAAVSVADVGAEAFAEGARVRREAVDATEGKLAQALASASSTPDVDIVAMWPKLSLELRTRALAGLIEAVVVTPSFRRQLPAAERVLVLAAGAGVVVREHMAGHPRGILPIVFDDLDRELVLGV
jgi:DNA invertase Pin-like site-specific DNA recombinase